MADSAEQPRPGRLRRLCGALALTVGSALAAVTASASPAWAGGPTITGTGSSYAALAINQWVAEMSALYGDNVNYSTQSSVIGLNDFAQYPQVDFGASEIGYSSGQADQQPPSGFAYQYLPDIAGAACMDYNLQSTIGTTVTTLRLTPAILVGIFTGSIVKWDDPAIQAANPTLAKELPNSPIIVVYRTDASGDNFIFSDYLNTTQPATWAAFTTALGQPSGAQAIWPLPPTGARTIGKYNFGNWTGENGSDNASNYVYQTPGTITYVETGYAILHHNPCAAVENASGAFVEPSEAADAVALQNDQLQPDLEQTLTPVFESAESAAYPISAYSYLVMAEESEIPSAKRAIEAQFVQFLACQGQEAAGKLGYSPLPPNLVEADFAAVQRIDGVTLPAPSASNCPDPYITGAFNVALNTPHVGTSSGSGGSSTTAPATGGTATTIGGGASGASRSASSGASGGGAASGSNGSSTQTTTSSSSQATSGGGSRHGQGRQRRHGNTVTEPQTQKGTDPGGPMNDAVDRLLGLPVPVVTVLVFVLGFIAVLVLPPVVGMLRQRRSVPHGDSEVSP